MWRKIGLIIGGVVILEITWLCSITIPLLIVARFFETTKLVIHITFLFIVVPLLLVCWLVGLWIGRKIGEKGWLYGGLPVLVFAVVTFLLPWNRQAVYFEEGLVIVESILVVLLVLLGVAGGIRGERSAKRRKRRI